MDGEREKSQVFIDRKTNSDMPPGGIPHSNKAQETTTTHWHRGTLEI